MISAIIMLCFVFSLFAFSMTWRWSIKEKKSKPILMIAGTRPEAIKLATLYWELKKQQLPVLFCSMGQHAELLQDALRYFQIQPDYQFQVMKPGQDLFHVTHAVLKAAKRIYRLLKPSLVIVQGDTTTAMAAALGAFYLQIPVAHIEAGLRTSNIHRPFPEEMNRQFIRLVANYHFAPTQKALEALKKEGVCENNLFCTGNTVVDALLSVKKRIQNGESAVSQDLTQLIAEKKKNNCKIVLLTAHRRESFGKGLISIFKAIKLALTQIPQLHIIFPVHPNPAILEAIEESGLGVNSSGLTLLPPLPYQDLVFALDAADLVLTDSGGLQEEATSLEKPVLTLRTETDRPEGNPILVGTDTNKILSGIKRLLRNPPEKQNFPYGDGTASQKIVAILKNIRRNYV